MVNGHTIQKDEIFVLTSEYDDIEAVCKATREFDLLKLPEEYGEYFKKTFDVIDGTDADKLPWLIQDFTAWLTIVRGYAIKIEARQLCVDTGLTNDNPISLAVFPFGEYDSLPLEVLSDLDKRQK